ncbi:S-adenosylmethionine hydrolase [Allocatelliglobosispora scoriae]|uniref:S-adenosylmethionine hydrolase n=1 Tax=Allocatelliglobosispora scoriae TaxID=643052 RepID=A0A841C0A1_9ACTN|nr:SAM-dependent chlorinase/fluorinase [Allocatelliglobosispora scoriae]MBB5872321.1 S-adenosylmethionine hydrolase [Allocatelliglobosispora scoriae]
MAGYTTVSFTTDYGLSDGFVAACHGVIARMAPTVRIIDVSHLVAPGDVPRGAAVLAQTVPHLPKGVHVAVVDPGVGTARRGICITTPNGLLVGPDNGLLPWAAEALGGISGVVSLENKDWFSSVVSRTFHGRDIFAPVAARLALGIPAAEAGPRVDPMTLIRLPDPVVAIGDGWLEAEVLTIDRFGNVQLAAPGSLLGGLPGRMTVGGCRAVNGSTFADVPSGGMVVYPDSADRIAVAVNGGRAAVVLAVTPGDVIRIAA